MSFPKVLESRYLLIWIMCCFCDLKEWKLKVAGLKLEIHLLRSKQPSSLATLFFLWSFATSFLGCSYSSSPELPEPWKKVGANQHHFFRPVHCLDSDTKYRKQSKAIRFLFFYLSNHEYYFNVTGILFINLIYML